MIRATIHVIASVFLFAAALPCHAQDESFLHTIITEGLSNANGSERTSDIIASIRETLESPDSQSRILNTYLQTDHGWQFLKDINFRFKAFDADSSSGASLGFSYDYQKSITDRQLKCRSNLQACARGLDWSLSAIGNVAFDSEKNPRDFLDTEFSFRYFQSKGGITESTDEQFQALLAIEEEFVLADTDEEEEAAIQKILALVRPQLTNQFYWEVAGDVSLESNQRFTLKQWTYGIRGVIEVKAWNNDTALAKYNIFDYPFAVIRALTDFDDCTEDFSSCFTPRGTAWPTVLVGFARVQPQNNDPRAQAGDSSDFDRLRLEASFRTPVARLGADNLYVSVNYRYFSELDASQVVKDADLDVFDFWTIVFGGSEGPYVSYSTGMLPLAFQDDKVFELGYQFHF